MNAGVQYVKDGKVIATDPAGLRKWILENAQEDFELWADGQFDGVSFHTLSVPPSDVLRSLAPPEYRQEMEYWIDNYLIYRGQFDPETLDIIDIGVVEILPPDDRTYRIEPAVDPWEVRAPEVYGYYEDADSMEVGDVYSNTAYKVVRTNNARRGWRR